MGAEQILNILYTLRWWWWWWSSLMVATSMQVVGVVAVAVSRPLLLSLVSHRRCRWWNRYSC